MMSDRSRKVTVMEAFDDETALTDWLVSEGLTVSEAVLPSGVWGLFQWRRRRILVHAGMPAHFRFPALLHEAHHYARSDHGHQAQAVEDMINRDVARQLIHPADFAWAESQVGGHAGGIAALLEVPTWVVAAFQKELATTH